MLFLITFVFDIYVICVFTFIFMYVHRYTRKCIYTHLYLNVFFFSFCYTLQQVVTTTCADLIITIKVINDFRRHQQQ